MQISKEERERLIFGLFAQAAGLMPGGSFTSRKPSEPDILYVDSNGSQSAFELVEILDRDYSSTVSRQLGTKDLCISYLESLSPGRQGAFRSKYANANIFIAFRENLSMRRREYALPALFEQLMSLPDGFLGDTLDDGLHPLVERVSIYRSKFVGPMFDAPSVVRVGDPTVEAIEGKLAKSYEPQGRLKLLAYIDGNPMFPEEMWLSNLDVFLGGLDGTCQFTEIFVYDCRANSIKRHWRAA